jgi:hypothetical protein
MKLLVAVMTCHRPDYYIDDTTVDWLNSKGLRSLDADARRAAMRATWLSEESRKYIAGGILFPESIDLLLHGTYVEAGDNTGFLDYKFFYGQQVRRLDIKPNQRLGTGGPAPQLRPALADEVYLPCGDGYIFNAAKMKEICRYALDYGYDYILRVDDDTLVLPELFETDWASAPYSGAATGAFHPGSCLFLSRDAMQRIVKARITNYADDLWIGQVMDTAGIPRHDIAGIRHEFGEKYAINPYTVKPTDVALHSCTPEVMRSLWTRRMTSLSVPPRATVGTVSEPTPSVSVSPASVDVKLSSPVTSPTLLVQPLPGSDLKSLTTPAPETTQLLSDLESFETGLQKTSGMSDMSFTVTSETL